MIQRGDKFINKGMVVEIKSALVDDHYIYVTFYEIGYRKIPLKYFLKRFISINSLLNIDYYIRKQILHLK